MKHLRISLCLLVTLASIGQLQPAKIHTAATLGRYYKVRSLLKQGVSPNERDKNGDTPLHRTLAGLGMKKATARLLVDAGADVNARNNDGNTPLHFARKKAMAVYLLEHKANVDAQNSNGVTPLHIAVVRGKPFLVSTLISAGADANLTDNNDIAPLHLATAISYLKSKSALTRPLDPAITQAGMLASIAAIYTVIGLGGAATLVMEVTSAGAPQVVEAVSISTPSPVEVLQQIHIPGPLRPEATLEEMSISLRMVQAAFKEQGKVLAYQNLLRKGVPSEEAYKSVYGPIAERQATGVGEKVAKPIGKYIAIAAAAITGIAATIVLVDMTIRNRILSLLLNAGAKVNARDKKGNTALHILADGKLLRPGDRRGGVLMAKRLIWNGADSLIKNNDGQLPYDLAKKHHRWTLYGTLRPGAAKKRQAQEAASAA